MRPVWDLGEDADVVCLELVEDDDGRSIELARVDIPREVIALVPRALAHDHWVVPVHRTARAMVVALVDPSDRETLDAVREATGLEVLAVRASSQEISAALWRYYRGLA